MIETDHGYTTERSSTICYYTFPYLNTYVLIEGLMGKLRLNFSTWSLGYSCDLKDQTVGNIRPYKKLWLSSI
jgi:hypothetical protein